MIKDDLEAHREVYERTVATLVPVIERMAEAVTSCLRAGGKILVFGNGGSAADAQHIASELTGRYVADRRGFAAIALTTDTSALTAISNDYGFEHVFRRQVEALARKGDVAIAISTSGNSPNIVRAIEQARMMGCTTIGLTGRDGGAMKELCDIAVIVPADDTARIQEMHILIAHALCNHVERTLGSP
jgi:D-sedoheptulose 7-phosphate isomerase